MRRFSPHTLSMLVAGLLLFATTNASPTALAAHGQAKTYGQVTSITQARKTGAIRSFDLAHGKHAWTFRVGANTQFVARSSKADVQGFAVNDYAYVVSRGPKAQSVEYDTSPFHPAPFSRFSGTVTRTGGGGLFVVRESDSAVRKTYRNHRTSYSVNGQPVENPIPINKGDDVSVYAEKNHSRWVAISIDEETSGNT